MYVIGGIVDRSVQKSRTLDCAYVHSIHAQRLPIKEHASSNLSHILNIDTVVNIICTFNSNKNWRETFDLCIPLRKKILGGKIQRRKLCENSDDVVVECQSSRCDELDNNYNNDNNNDVDDDDNNDNEKDDDNNYKNNNNLEI